LFLVLFFYGAWSEPFSFKSYPLQLRSLQGNPPLGILKVYLPPLRFCCAVGASAPTTSIFFFPGAGLLPHPFFRPLKNSSEKYLIFSRLLISFTSLPVSLRFAVARLLAGWRPAPFQIEVFYLPDSLPSLSLSLVALNFTTQRRTLGRAGCPFPLPSVYFVPPSHKGLNEFSQSSSSRVCRFFTQFRTRT